MGPLAWPLKVAARRNFPQKGFHAFSPGSLNSESGACANGSHVEFSMGDATVDFA
jgi:hypothetical protein